MLFGLHVPELLIILLVVALVFGPSRIGRVTKSLRRTADNFVREADYGDEDDDAPAKGSSKGRKSDKGRKSVSEDGGDVAGGDDETVA